MAYVHTKLHCYGAEKKQQNEPDLLKATDKEEDWSLKMGKETLQLSDDDDEDDDDDNDDDEDDDDDDDDDDNDDVVVVVVVFVIVVVVVVVIVVIVVKKRMSCGDDCNVQEMG
ncbi:hypothetical protein PoB_000633800 [Plakobranchus ocellatus]|uniref:Uncharacterized protein n=1 Tax=Plakobranchus ocellatus TaxID=259542 RepID=A0AAV3YBF8_9GAST|nr:hypothetical protein PoB_000633800 [Plakobranchus ocellatus]